MNNRRLKGPVAKPRVINPETDKEQKSEQRPGSSPTAAIRRFLAGVVRPSNVLSLQQTIGNKAVRRLLDDANQRKGRPDGTPSVKTGTVAGVVQRHKWSMSRQWGDQVHKRLENSISDEGDRSERITKAYYKDNNDRIKALNQRVSAVEGNEKHEASHSSE